ncbi:MAG: NADH:ubiquinone oxidoreductase [Candidatus Omnitrophica bacterium CG12_big_fil_rev_8_21_14_0_65_43_15]|uniref:NADH:ubiquinone oxidoreductase n=1 Tax=Candidatus Taenaricola geysiri TaxID=1974752 RepID=A0A2J0LPR8_9BACT|nr:MAG: NADH:ubiquinone oxidoreductase [Candidatus Omnitrophica bacterium CG1_02_43_210]PIR65856.1 MAG: NADH:ubiquinone oxidoreductase [Candidatus Omnitrophica bacterium CG10_big_fil_rev_8_21_14_0_10_43_8]PIV11870.1 MAG: NADH:ubiquinone oxidoreductase [Candidatus Omnitrophica bacterium CG03_land_8_20_14_0_80_43_22]PIW66766.1 MAG: NADH:ubiquinone oxidoreductase [Candidatus Omnitrophica bacterium CG12_big_fil_rev_8_21_14_0_65_43_15]PIW80331.1 MAG: NADH:ubiquinone oxidoreductase [Candidatus Omnitr
MSIKVKALTKSLWAFHLATGSCNNCDIEILDLLTPRFDVERFGIVLVGSIRHADVLLVTGVVNKKIAPRLKKLYEQTSKPCLVVAVGACACGQGIFRGGYNTFVPVDNVIPVDVYVPGCPPKPEAMILGVVKAIEKVKSQK